MLMINSVLTHVAPYSWEHGVMYDKQRYALFELSPGDEEYSTEINPFVNGNTRVNVTSLRRVQNPFHLGSFALRKQQKEHRGESVVEEKWYHPIDRRDLEIALEFNMDVRRYSHKIYGQRDSLDKNPKFYKTPEAADLAIGDCEKIIIICHVLGPTHGQTTISKENSTEYMPIYIANLS